MDTKQNELNKRAGEVEELSSKANMALAEMRIQFDTLTEMQKDERLEIQKMHILEKENLLKQFSEQQESQRKHYTKIILALILTLALLLGSIIGGVVYFFSTYDVLGVEQIIGIGGDGNPIINDGIHYDRTN